ncbi:hypothetical protein ACFW5X_33470 [Streptomyces albogriseolus]|uniref:hypothetical protein n=1 Tax=Streptomyces TaxID=1883 RepID=UPI001F60FD22|nr:hypothetical protein [Streptomyces sp. MMS20-AI2-20]MCI4146631.1 hypothetical protein [Streptomyces sp. MMS20-AI2-20]
MAFKKATVTSLLAGMILVATASTASADAGSWQETYRDFDSKVACDLTAIAWEANYPYNDFACFQLSSGRWTMKYRLKG